MHARNFPLVYHRRATRRSSFPLGLFTPACVTLRASLRRGVTSHRSEGVRHWIFHAFFLLSPAYRSSRHLATAGRGAATPLISETLPLCSTPRRNLNPARPITGRRASQRNPPFNPLENSKFLSRDCCTNGSSNHRDRALNAEYHGKISSSRPSARTLVFYSNFQRDSLHLSVIRPPRVGALLGPRAHKFSRRWERAERRKCERVSQSHARVRARRTRSELLAAE